MQLSGEKTGLPFSPMEIAPSVHDLSQSPQLMHSSSCSSGQIAPWNPMSFVADLGQSKGQPAKPTLNLWWPVTVPNSFWSTSRAERWVSTRPLGLYSQPPHAVGTLTLAPQEATFCSFSPNSSTTASKSLKLMLISS